MSWTNYKGLQVPAGPFSPSGNAGEKLKDNLATLADRAPLSVFTSTANPTVNDDVGDGYYPGSTWFNSNTNLWWYCVNNLSGAADWRTINPTSLRTVSTKSAYYLAVGGDLVPYNVTGGSQTLELPTNAPIDTRVGACLVATTLPNSLTILNSASPSPQILGFNGSEGASVKLFVAGDYVELQYIGSGTWLIVSDRRAPHAAELNRTTAQTINDNTETLCDFNAIPFDNAGLASTSNDKFTIRRSGRYAVSGNSSFQSVSIQSDFELRIKLNSSLVRRNTVRLPASYVSQHSPAWQLNVLLNLTAGDELTLFIFQDNNNGTSEITGGTTAGQLRFTISELR